MMGKKRIIGLVPLLAVVAFVVAPAVAQAACPTTCHFFVNHSEGTPGEKVPYVSWGTLKLTNTSGASVECENAVTGWNENPTGGGAGISMVTGWTASSCKNAECEAVAGHIGVVFENETAPGTNPPSLEWPGTIVEPKANVWRLDTTNVKVFTRCQLGALQGVPNPEVKEVEVEPTNKISERTGTEFYAGGSVCKTGGGGSSASRQLSDGSEAAKPSKVQFTGGEGGELNCEAAGKGITTGTLKTQGAKTLELLTISK